LAGLAPIVVLVALRGRLGSLNAASWLVVWGALFVAAEHAGWSIWDALQLPGVFAEGGLATNPHARVHAFMAGVYTVFAALLLVLIAWTLLREGRRIGWYAVLVVLVAGGGLELLINGPNGVLFQHGFPPRSRPEGMVLFNYLIAWMAALAIAYRPVFGSPRQARRTGNASMSSESSPILT